MTLSNALPVQFWTDPDESFNNKVICGRESVCWCHPWNCDDQINLQFPSYTVDDYSLNVLDSSDNILETIPFDQELQNPTDYLSGYPLSGFTNEAGSGDSDWTTGTNPTVTETGGIALAENSDNLIETITGIAAGDYLLTMNYTASGLSNGTLRVIFRKAGVIVGSFIMNIVPNGTNIDISSDETLTDEPDKIEISVRAASQASKTVTINALSLVRVAYLNSLVFSPEDYCGQQIKLQIVNNSDETDFATSDCLSIKTSHSCTELITYSNSRDFAGLIYNDVSPAQEFTIRVPAIFFDIENPAEQEDIELSNGEIVRLWNKLERKRLLDFSFLPPFMHEKLQLILMHDTIEIDGREWIRRDAYTKTEGNKRYPLKRASVWLHDKNFITENQL